jgi:hypothetical protein
MWRPPAQINKVQRLKTKSVELMEKTAIFLKRLMLMRLAYFGR